MLNGILFFFPLDPNAPKNILPNGIWFDGDESVKEIVE